MPALHTGQSLHLVVDSAGLRSIEAGAKSGRREWKKVSGYHRRSQVENLMHRLKTLTSHSPWTREPRSQATEVAIRAGVLNRMAALARPHSVCVA
uniref:Transposase n=1 Tax=Ralstonia solanacearum TaxID=305 RepID=A0A0S4TRC8_RALSL|nr:protein of unknown function [Ralstonia solanacearum]